MGDDSKQGNTTSMKVLREIKIDTKPKGYNEKIAQSTAKVNYVHKALDKLAAELNKDFVPQLDDVLNSNKESINQLRDTLGDKSKGLVKALAELEGRIQSLENSGDDGSGLEWEAPQLQYTDTELI